MIIYFTGTGNSKFVADYLAENLNDNTVCLNEYIKANKQLVCDSEKPYILVAPIYAWRLPAVVETAIQNAQLNGNKNVYCIVTMGENSGNADKYAEKLFVDKGMNFTGCIGVAMQNNYLTMEKMPEKDVADRALGRVVQKLEFITRSIKEALPLSKDDKTPMPALMSGLVNWGFNSVMLKNPGFATNESCNLCGSCVEICPVNNITLKDGKIKFGTNCAGCFGCLHRCPAEAINIKNQTQDKGRYICPEYSTWKQKYL